MSDISVGKLSNDKSVKKTKRKERYSYLKKEYKSFMKKSAKSDFANSPVLKQKEFEMLVKMKEAAEKEGLTEEVSFVETKIAEITAPPVMELPSSYYPPISSVAIASNSDRNTVEQSEDEIEETVSGEYKHDFSSIISAFKQNNIDDYELSYLLKKIDNYDGELLSDITNFIELFAKLGIHPNTAVQAIEEFCYVEEKENFDEKLDIRACQRFADLKTLGLEDVQALKFAKHMKGEFEDENLIENLMVDMVNAKISEDAAIDILNALSVENSTSKKKKISPNAVKSVINLKTTLIKTRRNEKKERENPINRLGVVRFEADGKIIIMKDNEVTYITPAEGESVFKLKEEYDNAISEIEDNILVQFASKYRNKDGETDLNALRTMTALRRAGVTYDRMLEMTDFCISEGSIDSDKLNTICTLKKAGCLGADILDLMTHFNKSDDGKYDEEDIKNACDLTAAVIRGKEVGTLLPEVYGNEDIKDLLIFFSQLFDNKANLEKLFPLIEKENGTFDENAISILYNLAENLYDSENPIKDSEFLENANELINAALNKESGIVEDEEAGICAVMCRNKYTTAEIIQGLDLCKDGNGKTNKRLSELIWQMALKNADIEQITRLIKSVCFDKYNNVNNYMAKKLAEYLQKGCSIDKVTEFILEE